MQSLSTLVTGLEFKSRQVADKMKELQRSLNDLHSKYQQLEIKYEQQKQTINDLDQKIQILKITHAIPKGKETADVKKKINELLRELDRSIDLLNNRNDITNGG
ncbi:MAG TPA: hypothetical protein PLP88_07675 [Bacteroidales bacterium]|nr:hypothetical protein [Bacteroidales bacterium]